MLNSKLSSISPAILFALAQGFFAAHSIQAQGTLYEYVGPNGGSWFTPSNWKSGLISVEGDSAETAIKNNLTARIDAPGAVAQVLYLGGQVIVDGAGTLNTSVLLSGYQSMPGSLVVSNGGDVTVTNSTGVGYGADASVTVSGPGSTFTQTGSGSFMTVGVLYNGSLTVSDGGLATFRANGLNIGYTSSENQSSGTVLVSNDGILEAVFITEEAGRGRLTLDGGTLRALSGPTSFLRGFEDGHVILGPSGGTIDTRFNSIAIKSSIAGVGALKKIGTGTLDLEGSSTYTGGTVLQEGTVQISSNENLGAAGSLLTLTGGSLALEKAMTFTHPITVTSSGGAIGGGFNGAPFYKVTIQGTISGTGPLKKIGTADLVLTGNNISFSGGFQVTSGSLIAGTSTALGAATVSLDNNTAIRLANGLVIGNAVSIAGTGTILNDGSAAVAYYNGTAALNGGTLVISASGADGGSLIFSGSATGTGSVQLDSNSTNVLPTLVIAGAGLKHAGTVTTSAGGSGVTMISGSIGANVTGVTQQGSASKLILSGNNLYTGDTTVTAGTLQIGDGGTSGSVAGNIVNNDALIFNRSDSYTYAKDISGSGSLEKQGAGTLTLSGAVSYTGATTISGGTLAFDHSGSLKLNGVISGPGRLVKQGSGELILTGDNTFAGGTTVNSGTLSVGEGNDDGALVAGASVNAVTLAGGNLNLRAGSIRGGAGVDVVNATAGNGGIGVIQNSPATISNSGTISGGAGGNGNSIVNNPAAGGAGGAGVAINAATTFNNHGTISGGAGGSVTNGPGFGGNGGVGIAFTATGTLTNQGTITGGMGGFGINMSGVAGAGVLVSGGGTLVTAPGSVIQGAPNITGGLAFGVQFSTMAGTLLNQGAIVGGVLMDNLPNSVTLFTGSQIVNGPLVIGNNPAATLTLDGAGTHSLNTAVPGGIGFAGSLTKQGSGTWTIDQNFPSPGPTSVAEGKLLVTGSIAGSISAASGATLGGTGTISGNASINGTLAPGISTGLLTFNSNLTLNSGSITAIEIGGLTTTSFDRISVDDFLTYGGTLSLSLINGFAPKVGDTFQLFQDFNSQSGTFSSIVFTNPGVVGSFNYFTGTLNIVAIPEPSSAAFVGTALLGLLATRSRRNRPLAAN